ncbi:MAG TPA: sulfotransferase [Thermoleophilaceae bacterium]|nr:sulfotransferase [Thermoleophilaceae bacterium]
MFDGRKSDEGLCDGPPDFVGVGAQRAGTTWWYSLITAHPGVEAFPQKECHFFDTFCDRPFDAEDVQRYRAQFRRSPGTITGEWTPRYAYDFWTPQLLQRAAPNAKILFLLRNPIERYRSGLALLDRQGLPRSSPEFATFAGDAAHRGRYAEQLRRLRNYFPAEQILVLQYERCQESPVTELRRTYAFLGLDDWSHEVDVREPRGIPSAESKPELTDAVRDELVFHLERDVDELKTIAPQIELDRWPEFAHLLG